MKKRGRYKENDRESQDSRVIGISNKERLVTALEVPKDLAYGDAVLTVTGRNMAVIENYRGILRYTREEIIVLTFGGRLTICGRHLEIPCFTREEMQIRGCISHIFLEQ